MNGYKKPRGLNRYYKNLAKRNELDDEFLDLKNPGVWFDTWHVHFDNRGYGNNSFKSRKAHLNKLFRHFDMMAEKTAILKPGSFQLYAIVWDYDSYDDALYLHTPNPNNNPFPFETGDLELASNLTNQSLNNYISNLTGYEKRYGIAEQNYCLLFKPDIGLSF